MTSKSVDFAGTPAQPAARLVASKGHALLGPLWPNADELHLTALPPILFGAPRARRSQMVREFRPGVRHFVERLAPFPSATGVEKFFGGTSYAQQILPHVRGTLAHLQPLGRVADGCGRA